MGDGSDAATRMKNIIALAIVSILGSIALFILFNYKSWDEGGQIASLFLMTICFGLAGGVLTFMYILPTIGDKISEQMLSGSGKVEPTENSKAIAKLMQGDYDGAISEFQKLADEKPGDTHPVMEISKIHADKLEDPDTGIAYLEGALEQGEWDEEGTSFLTNRLADLNIEHNGDYDTARSLLQQIVEALPGTRYSANATHRLRKLEEEEMQAQLAAQRQEQQLGGGQEDEKV